MNTDIRKISVGKDYPDGAMHYQVGKTMRLQGIPYEIYLISSEKGERNSSHFDIFIKNENGIVKWKSIIDMPVIVENNINFD